MKIAVGGTGFASFMCIKYLLSMGIKPVVFDIDNEISEKNKMYIKTNSIINIRDFNKYLTLGGLSNIWTGVIEKYLKSDFAEWPINKNDLETHYDQVFEFLNYSEIHSFYSKSEKNILDYDIKKINGLNNNSIYSNEEFLIKFASLLVNKSDKIEDKKNHLDNLLPFSFREEINKLIKNSEIELRNERICKVSENKNHVLLETINSQSGTLISQWPPDFNISKKSFRILYASQW